MRGYMAALIGTILGCLVIALTTIPGLHPSTMLANRWAEELPDLPDKEVESRLEQIAGLGDASVPILVNSMASERQVLADASEETLREQIGRWQLLSRTQSSQKVALLAEHLARKVDDFKPRRRNAAADIAMQILLWPIDDNSVDSRKLIANCERVLRGANGLTSEVASNNVAPSTGPTTMSLSDSHSLGLPAAIVDIPSLPVAQNLYDQLDTSTNDEPNAFDTTLASDEVTPMTNDGIQRLTNAVNAKPIESVSPTVNELERMESSPAPPTAENAIHRLETLDHVAVMSFLRHEHEQTSLAAADELERRGFTENDLYLALQLTDPDSTKRIELARLLPRMTGVDSRRWLFWLSEDKDAGVRAEAVSILVTIRDPQVQKYLKSMAERETSPSVLQHFRR